ncbi:MAG TPA: efflux transporter outer membrane subunit, partial [Burkholderiaceae bacterium]|nr:efflux transporter outer membrane subunit [Burkholderiaceae bacterium]
QMKMQKTLLVAATLLVLAGCSSLGLDRWNKLAPAYERPAAPVPAQWPASAPAVTTTATEAAPLPWRQLVLDARPRQLVERALANNRDLRAAMLNVARARALLDASTAGHWPAVNAGLNASRAPSAATGKQTTTLNAGLSVTAWEIDLFGRLGSLDDAARAQWLATEAGRRSAELSLVTQVLSTYLTLVSDEQQLQLAERTLATRDETLRLTRLKAGAGTASDLDLRSTETLAAQARASRAQLTRQREQDRNALAWLLGEPVPENLLPPSGDATALIDATWLAEVPVGASSQVLLSRPDVVQAEQQLIVANANIGAARAALFPRLTLTSSAGTVSDDLAGLFKAGNFAWSLAGQFAATIFDGGRNRANLEASRLARDAAVAQYERSVQTAFRETADALAGLATWRDQVAAQREQLTAERERSRLVQLRRDRGAASDLEWLDAQRALFATEQATIQARLAELQNRLALYRALGGEQGALPAP